jgi:hypothetical protein
MRTGSFLVEDVEDAHYYLQHSRGRHFQDAGIISPNHSNSYEFPPSPPQT